jgi:hypothetical protein
MGVYKCINKYVKLMETYLARIKPNVSNVWRTDELYLKVKGNTKTVHFTGTGIVNVANKVTDSTGKATGTGIAPNSVANGWTYQAQYAGSNLYTAVVYITIKHHTAAVTSSTITTIGGISQQLRQNPSTSLPPPILVR